MENLVKQRTTVWLYPKTFAKIDSAIKLEEYKSRSEFVEKAVDFYIGYLNSKDSTAYLSEHIMGAIDGSLKNTENRISSNLFRLSVEMSVMMNLLATAIKDIDDEWIAETRYRSIADIKKSKGRVLLEESFAYKYGDEG